MVEAVLRGLDDRFKYMFSDELMKIASISDPSIKLIWIEDDDKTTTLTC